MTEHQIQQWPDLSGRIEDNKHILPIRVYFEDTDFTGVVYHATYLRWCERGRSDFVRLLGIHHNELLNPEDGAEPSVFVVRNLEIDYLRPAKIDEILEVITEVEEIGGATITLKQQVIREKTILAKLKIKIVLINQSGKPQRIGQIMKDAFTSHQNLEK